MCVFHLESFACKSRLRSSPYWHSEELFMPSGSRSGTQHHSDRLDFDSFSVSSCRDRGNRKRHDHFAFCFVLKFCSAVLHCTFHVTLNSSFWRTRSDSMRWKSGEGVQRHTGMRLVLARFWKTGESLRSFPDFCG